MLQQFFESTLGITLTAVIILLALLAGTGYLKARPERNLSGRQATMAMVFSAMAITLGTVLSVIPVFKLPQGGSVTLLSMFAVSLIGYFYGPVQGIISGVAYGMLQLILDPYVIHPLQLILDYPLAFGMLGLSGLFYKKKYGLLIGYLVGVSGRFICSLISGIVFFGDYASGTGMSPFIYSLVYNGSYMGAEALMTSVVILLPSVRDTVKNIRNMATA